MLNLLNAIRKREQNSPAGKAEINLLDDKMKRLVIAEWEGILNHNPKFIQTTWIRSANRSASIKKTFGVAPHEDPSKHHHFKDIGIIIQAFFQKIIIDEKLEDTQNRRSCEALGARHLDFVAQGFNSTFWDIFLVCMEEVILETLETYTLDTHRRTVLKDAFERVFATIVHYMRTGYQGRRRREMNDQRANGTNNNGCLKDM